MRGCRLRCPHWAKPAYPGTGRGTPRPPPRTDRPRTGSTSTGGIHDHCLQVITIYQHHLTCLRSTLNLAYGIFFKGTPNNKPVGFLGVQASKIWSQHRSRSVKFQDYYILQWRDLNSCLRNTRILHIFFYRARSFGISVNIKYIMA